MESFSQGTLAAQENEGSDHVYKVYTTTLIG